MGRPARAFFPAEGGDSQPILPRAVANPTTPNQILDAVLEGAIAYMETLGWCDSKNVQNGESNLPFQVNSDGSSSENFHVLTGSVVVENARANADYTVTFAGVGEAPAQNCFCNLDSNNIKDVHSAGFRKALREIVEKTMSSNVKVQINKSIQDMKNA
ncbi:uncharacterized protein LOC119595516 [Penaeus monodon]|uniref:uncharacterized protein LOC119595516 n=1 Tax=Penaeus monodon TaxID=6687 RepID=UPI0018A78A1F|nr:uncharacterized protein LOC119595516 [Penaeus monodon]